MISAALSLNPFYYKGRYQVSRDPRDLGKLVEIGYVNDFGRSANEIDESYDLTFFREIIPSLNEYKFPDGSPSNVLMALLEQLEGDIELTPYSRSLLTEANDLLLEQLPKIRRQRDHFTVGDFQKVIDSMDRTKSSGFPGSLFAPLKGQILKDEQLLFHLIQAVVYRIFCLEHLAPYCKSPNDFYMCFCADIQNVSIKKEPVKTSKRGRILTAPGIVSFFVEALIYQDINAEIKATVYEGYSGIGIGFSTRDSVILNTKHDHVTFKSDVPKFDTTVTEEEGLMNVELASMAGGFGPRRKKIAQQLERTFFSKLVNIAGTIYEHVCRNWQLTGRNNTSRFNTDTRSRRAKAAALDSLLYHPHQYVPSYCDTVVGDDCEETALEDLASSYQRLGFPLRDVDVSLGIGLCSHQWPQDGPPVGVRVVKSLVSLLQEGITYDRVVAFYRTFRNHHEFSELFSVISAHRPEVKYHIKMFLDSQEYTATTLNYVGCKAKKKKQTKVKKTVKSGFIGPLQPNQKRAGSTLALTHAKRGHVSAACSILDPFCHVARAAKRPDGMGANTIGLTVRSLAAVTTDSTGACLIVLVPGYGRYGYASGTLAAGSFTLASTWTTLPGSAFLDSIAAEVRVVSAGAIFHCTASMTNCQGVLHRFVLTNPRVAQVIPQLQQNNSEDKLDTLTAGKRYSFVAKPMGSAAHTFKTYTSFASNMGDFDWTSCGFEVSGGPASTTIGMIEIVQNVEVSVSTSQSSASGMTGTIMAPRPANTVALQVQNKVHTMIPSLLDGGVDYIEKRVASAASSALDSFLGGAANVGAALLTML